MKTTLQKKSIKIFLSAQEYAKTWLALEGMTRKDLTDDQYIELLRDISAMNKVQLENIQLKHKKVSFARS